MVENRPVRDVFAHAVLILGVVAVAFPLWVTFVASTLTFDQIVTVPMPLWPGDQFLDNYTQVLTAGSREGLVGAGFDDAREQPDHGARRYRWGRSRSRSSRHSRSSTSASPAAISSSG